MTLVLAVVVVMIVVMIVVITAITTPVAIVVVIGPDGRAGRAAQGTADDGALGTSHVRADTRARTAADRAAQDGTVIRGERSGWQRDRQSEYEFAHVVPPLTVTES